MEGDETCKTQLSHYPHHLIRAGMCQKIILSILSFAHTLQTPNGWTRNTFAFSSASIPSETDPLRGEFYASSTFVHFLPKGYSRAGFFDFFLRIEISIFFMVGKCTEMYGIVLQNVRNCTKMFPNYGDLWRLFNQKFPNLVGDLWRSSIFQISKQSSSSSNHQSEAPAGGRSPPVVEQIY